LDEHGDLWIRDVYRGRWDASEIVENLLACWEAYKPDLMGAEEGQIKLALGPFLEKAAEEREMWDFQLEPLKPGRRDKVLRGRSMQGMMRRRRVKFLKSAPWLGDLVRELMQFPNGVNDDQCDALNYLGLMLQEMSYVKRKEQEEVASPLPGERPWRDRLRELVAGKTVKDWMAA